MSNKNETVGNIAPGKPSGGRSMVKRVRNMLLLGGALFYVVILFSVFFGSNFLIEHSLEQQARRLLPVFDDMGAPVFFSEQSVAVERITQYATPIPDIARVRYYERQHFQILAEYNKPGAPLLPPLDAAMVKPFAAANPANLASPGEAVGVHYQRFVGIAQSIQVFLPVRVHTSAEDNLLDFGQAPNNETSKVIGYVEVVMDFHPSRATIYPAIFAMMGLLSLAAALNLILIVKHMRAALRPLLNLQEPLKRIAQGDFDATVGAEKADDEIESIRQALNATIKALKRNEGERNMAVRAKILAEQENQQQAAALVGMSDENTALNDALVQLQQTQTQLEAAHQTAQDASMAKSMFLANMSHEIRTPMNAIIGMAYLSLRTELNPKQQDYVSKIHRAAQSLLGLIDDILDFSKVEAGKLNIEEVNFSLSDVFNNIANVTSQKAAAKELEYLFHVEQQVPRNLVGDPLRLGQILINLVNNAVKFTEMGEIEVTCVLQKQSCAPNDGKVMLKFAVADSGIGMTRQQCAKLFMPFTQADGSISRKYGGTGLGLAIAKSLAELMGGEIGVDSEVGVGSTFWFTACFALGVEESAPELPEPELRGRRVLVVDDNAHAQVILAEMLTSLLFRVDVASSGAAALIAMQKAVARQDPYQIAFLDWQMPMMNGFQLAYRMAREISQPPCPVIVSAYDSEELNRASEVSKIALKLVKPIDPAALLSVVIRALGGGATKKQASAVAKTDDESGLVKIRGARVLLVDDNDMNQQVGRDLLLAAQFWVDVADNGQIALDMVSKERYDLVLMDMQMPVMDGLEATRQIRALSGLANMPIIAMTANAMNVDRQRCLDSGMNDHISKPIDPDELYRKLQKWISPRETDYPLPVKVESRAVLAGAALFRIHGLDAKAGLRRILGQREAYEDLLRKFTAGQASAVATIRALQEAGEHDEALRIAHTLKGTADTIGAGEVARAAEKVETALLESAPNEAILALLPKVSALLDPLIEALKAALPIIHDPTEVSEIDWPTARQTVSRLEIFLAGDDADAVELFHDSSALLKAVLGKDFAAINRAINCYELVDALEMLLAAKAKIAEMQQGHQTGPGNALAVATLDG